MEFGSYGKGSRLGCIIPFVVLIALIGGSVFFFIRGNDEPGEEESVDQTLAALETRAVAGGTVQAPTPTNTTAPIAPTVATEASVTNTQAPTPDLNAELATERKIFFPNASAAGRIVTARRVPGGWDITYLQDLVGHLEGTPWLGEGNTVLAGHFEDELGRPGPFRYLYEAKEGDRILIQDGKDAVLQVYVVTVVTRTTPDDLEVLRNTDDTRLTLITCDSWNPERSGYDDRLVVIAEPLLN